MHNSLLKHAFAGERKKYYLNDSFGCEEEKWRMEKKISHNHSDWHDHKWMKFVVRFLVVVGLESNKLMASFMARLRQAGGCEREK